MSDAHDVLGVSADATAEEIRRAWRRLARESHPDVRPDDPDAAERFLAVTAAHDTLVAGADTTPKTRKPRRRRSPRGLGCVYLRNSIWWVSVTHGGEKLYGSTKSDLKQVAVDLLKDCHAAIRTGTFASIEAVRDKVRHTSGATLADLRDRVVERAKRQRLRSAPRHGQAFEALVRHLGEGTAVEEIDEARIEEYVRARQRDPIGSARRRDKKGNLKCPRLVSDATINREVTLLRQGLTLLGVRVPKFERLPESDPRQGFPQPGELERVAKHLPQHLRQWARFLEATGWRAREALKLEWRRHVDLQRGQIRLAPSETKARREPRILPFAAHPVLAEIIQERRAAAAEWERLTGTAPTHVFWQPTEDAKGKPVAKPIANYSKLWNRACKRAKVTLLPHDLRRGFARAAVLAGLDERTAMRLAGWRTRSTFDRYGVRNERDLSEGVAKLARATTAATATEDRSTSTEAREA